MEKFLFSIVTPCYRGTNTLRRTFNSLQSQCNDNISFEWILVDDYSNDDNQTITLINELCKQALFPTKTIFLEKNHYGSRSIFLGANIATGQYIIILDQDDMLVVDGLLIFKRFIDKYQSEENLVGVCGRCINMDNNLIGSTTQWDEIISNELAIRHIYKVRGEMFQCTKRDIILEYFSDFVPGYTNGYAWMRIARKYQYVYTNNIVRRYDTINPLSHSNSKKINYIDAQIDMLRYHLINNRDYLSQDVIALIRTALQYIRLSFDSGLSIKQVLLALLKENQYIALPILPLGLLRHYMDLVTNRIDIK